MKTEKKEKLNVKIYTMCAVTFLVSLLFFTSCGQNSEIAKSGSKKVVGVTSGAAFEMSASAGAVSGEAAEFYIPPYSVVYNSTNYYEEIFLDDETNENSYAIVERELDGTPVRQYESKEPIMDILWVSDEELFYSSEYGGSKSDVLLGSIWCVPVQKMEGNDELVWEKREEVLRVSESENGEDGDAYIDSRYFYADDNYFVFLTTGTFDFKVYDRKNKRFVKITGTEERGFSMPNNLDLSMGSVKNFMWNDQFFVQGRRSGELFCYHLGDDHLEKISDGREEVESVLKISDGDEVFAGARALVDAKRGHLLYEVSCIRKSTSKREGEMWMSYDCATGKKEKLYSLDELKKIFGRVGADESWNVPPELYIDGDSLYVIYENDVVRLDLAGEKEPEYVKNLSEFLRDNAEGLGGNHVEYFQNKYCYCRTSGDDEDRLYRYDMERGELVHS